MLEKVRIDKWLWSVRIFKSRSISSEACRSGQIKFNDSSVKPSWLVVVGNIIQVKKNGFNYQYKVVKLIDKRVSAPLAAECYINQTPEDEMKKFEQWFVGKSKGEFREKGKGRPTKKDRRNIDGLKFK